MNSRNHKLSKTFFSLLLAIALSLALVPSLAFATNGTGTNNNGTTKQNDEADATSYTGLGTEASPFKIADAQDLLDFTRDYNAGVFANKSGLFAVLTDNIDLSGHTWEPIGSSKTLPFSGSFDGQGFTVSGLSLDIPLTNAIQDRYYPCGLFGYVAQGEIKHLGISATIKTVASNDGVPCAGILAGMLSPPDGASISIEDCRAEGSVAVKGGNLTVAGGLIGCISLAGANQSISITDVTSSASAIAADTLGTSFAGGFIGHINTDTTDSTLAIKDCEATGTATITQTAKANKIVHEAGGFIGGLFMLKGTAAVELTRNSASGIVSTSGDVQFNDGGGFIGYLQALSGTCSIESCSSSSEVKASGTTSDADVKTSQGLSTANTNETGNDTGGLIGYLLVDGGTVVLSSVSATGPASSQGGMKRNDSGGLIGFIDVQKGSSLGIESSSASGAAEARDAETNNAGGLIGRAELQEASALNITSSHAKGNTKAQSGTECYAGGFMGNAEISEQSALTITNCSSSSETSTSSAIDYGEAGGLIGCLHCTEAARTIVSSCFATGKATAADAEENYAGGLMGSAYADNGSKTTIKDCYALGDANATGKGNYNDAGGLIGYVCAENATSSISFCYAAGLATATGTAQKENAAGGIIGYADALDKGSLTLAKTVAVNAFVTSTDSKNNLAGRVLGSFGTEATATISLEANYAWDDMLLNDEAVSDSDTNGIGTTKKQLLTGTFWGSSEDEGMQIDSSQKTDAPDTDIQNDEGNATEDTTTTPEEDSEENRASEQEEGLSSDDDTSPTEDAEGPGFNGAQTWNLVDGSLPLLKNPTGAVYTPPYLKTTQDAPAPSMPRNIDIAPTIALIAGCFVAILLIWLVVYLIRRRRRKSGQKPNE